MTSIDYNILNNIQKIGIGGFGVLTIFQVLSPEIGLVLGPVNF